MGTPVCRVFTPTPHQQFTALELARRLYKVQKLQGNFELQFLIGANIWGQFHYGGLFQWVDRPKGASKSMGLCYYYKKNCSIHNVTSAEFLVIGDYVAIWRKKLLQWELVEHYIKK